MKVESMRFVVRDLGGVRRGWMSPSLKACAEPSCKSLPSTALVQSFGRSSAWGWLSRGYSASNLAKRKSGGSWVPWVLARKSLRSAPSSATKMQRAVGNAAPGLPLKKSPARRPTDRLCGRVRHQRTSHARTHLGAQGADSHHSVSLQLESRLGYCRAHAHQLFVQVARGQHQERTDRRISQSAEGPSQATPAGDLGWPEGASQPSGARLSRHSGRAHPHCLSSSLRPRPQSGRISVGLAQATRVGQLLSQRSERVAHDRTQQTQERAKASLDHCCLLDAGYALVMS